MHTFLTVTANGTKFHLSVVGHSHGQAFKHAQRLADGCTVKHEADLRNTGAFAALEALKVA